MRGRNLNPVCFMSQQLNSYWYKKEREPEERSQKQSDGIKNRRGINAMFSGVSSLLLS